MTDVIIPSCKTVDELAPMVCDVEGFSFGHKVITTCTKGSASQNRNIGLNQSDSDIVIMIDDDISGFYDGWIDDLIKPLQNPAIIISSAHLVKTDGTDAAMMFQGNRLEETTEVPRVPTAAIAFRKTDLRFHEDFIGSGYEDDFFCHQMQDRFPAGAIVIANKCLLIHANEMKNQTGKYAEKNKATFDRLMKEYKLGYVRDGEVETPKIIHFVWLGNRQEWVDKNIAEFKKLNPGYKIMVHGKESLDSRLEKHFKSAETHEKKYSLQSDLIRVSALLKHGGWYFDTDMFPLVPISEMPKKDRRITLFASKDGNVVANGVIGCSRADQGLKELFRIILSNYKEKPEWWSYGTWCTWNLSKHHRELLDIHPIYKIIPVGGKTEALRCYNSKIELEKLKTSGAYMLHMEMQNSTDIHTYYSEHGQDKWLNDNIFKNKKNGVFAEIGVIDGKLTSNSLFFEESLGWTGLLVEANPIMESAIKQNRPKCKIEMVAVSDRNGEAEFLTCNNVTGWSGLSNAIEPQHAERIKQHHGAGQTVTVKVKTAPLAGILIKHNMSKIDYMSIDIEGAEYDALRKFPFDQFDIDIFDIENNYNTDAVEKVMTAVGYKKIARLGVNDIYRRKV